jgi:hypothetical protein
MHKEGDGGQKLELFKHPAEKVLQELMSDILGLDVSTLPSRSTWILMETDCLQVMQIEFNRPVSFQLAQLRIGEGKVPVSLVI